MIEVRGLNKYYKSFHALKGIDLNVKKGEIYGFIGRNGAGKSTTMNILAGLSRPTSGECIVNGKNLKSVHNPAELDIGYLPEEPKFYPWLSAYETLEYLGSTVSQSITKTKVIDMLEWVGLRESASRRVGGFSRGMRQRLAIGAALIRDPELLLLDEPSSALDPGGRSDVLNLIKSLKERGKTIFFSTHILDDIERICDRVGILENGKLVLEEPLKTLLSEHISPVFDVMLKAADKTIKDEISKLEVVEKVVAEGERLSVTVKNADSDSRKLLAFFANQNMPVRSIALRKNSLEDIFIKEVSNQ